MGRLTRTLAGLAVAAAPVLGAVAAQPGGVLADNGVIHGNTTGAPSAVRILATDGVIHAEFAGASGSVTVPADDGVISSRS